jgi:hypothetical protein
MSPKSRVPVSTQVTQRPIHEIEPGPVGLNVAHESRLITYLVDYYGWTLCSDGNLYNPNPSASQLRSNAA